MKKLSIVIPVYNAQNYIRECLESILISSKSFEVVLIDDGSKDNSLNICEEYSKKDGRVKVFHKENGGVSSARNYGIKKATGDYLMFVDSDDVMLNEWDKIIDYVDSDDICYFNKKLKNIENKDELLKYIVGDNNEGIWLSGPYSKIFSTRLIRDNNISFNENIINGEDMLFNIEVALEAKSFKVVNMSYYLYRQVVGQATRRFDIKIINSDRKFHEHLGKIFDKYKVKGGTKIQNYCLYNAVYLILNRISYIKGYNNAKKYFEFLNEEPYKKVVNDVNNNTIVYKLCRKGKYKSLFYYLKIRNKVSFLIKYKARGQFIEIYVMI